MRFSFLSGVRNDLLQIIADKIQDPWGFASREVISVDVGVNIGPHAAGVAATYTVPADKRGLLVSSSLTLQRHTAASSGGAYEAQVIFTPTGGTAQRISRLGGRSILVGEIGTLPQYYNLPMVVGDKVELLTSDGSTGGVVFYELAASILEFDI